mmetsp:Transcript_63146/g.181074  ORF Transcript_63146/g.181074 Transcript_63146/m.181074 type:complete len:247 (-) Transcript_63146:111-851(-)
MLHIARNGAARATQLPGALLAVGVDKAMLPPERVLHQSRQDATPAQIKGALFPLAANSTRIAKRVVGLRHAARGGHGGIVAAEHGTGAAETAVGASDHARRAPRLRGRASDGTRRRGARIGLALLGRSQQQPAAWGGVVVLLRLAAVQNDACVLLDPLRHLARGVAQRPPDAGRGHSGPPDARGRAHGPLAAQLDHAPLVWGLCRRGAARAVVTPPRAELVLLVGIGDPLLRGPRGTPQQHCRRRR